MDEIAGGLHDNGVRYLWVARGDTSRLNFGPERVQAHTNDNGLPRSPFFRHRRTTHVRETKRNSGIRNTTVRVMIII
ncbi:hypothetical protein NC651_022159 [Populus alba x Populus x berolinensis]|nr:hypothetical protein NC651_022159 [Populus alba x Populus x berolinensis]